VNTKHEIIIRSDTGVPDALLAVLGTTYSPEKVKQASAQGAKIRIVVTTPWPKLKKLKPKVVIAPSLLEELHGLAGDSDALESKISKLNGPQILRIGEILGIPMPKSGKTEALRARLFGSLRSKSIWKGISGEKSPKPIPPAVKAGMVNLRES
jgi:hypothetical protein